MRRPQKIVDIISKIRDGSTGYTGFCTHCGGKAAKDVHFKDGGVIVIEKYCDSCMEPSQFSKLQEFYSMIK